MNTKLKTLVQALVDEINETKGIRDAVHQEKDWWRLIDWKTKEYQTLFDSLGEETRNFIIEAGLCPECMDAAKTEAERAMSHFKITPEDWAKLSDEEKQKYIEKLPKEEDEITKDSATVDEYDLEQDWYVEQELGKDKALSYKEKSGHPDSDYAYIDEGCKKEDGKTQQSCRHLLIHDPAHVRAALSALKGGRTGKIPPYASKAKPKVCAAAKKFKIESEVCGLEKKKKDALDPYEVMKRANKLLNPT